MCWYFCFFTKNILKTQKSANVFLQQKKSKQWRAETRESFGQSWDQCHRQSSAVMGFGARKGRKTNFGKIAGTTSLVQQENTTCRPASDGGDRTLQSEAEARRPRAEIEQANRYHTIIEFRAEAERRRREMEGKGKRRMGKFDLRWLSIRYH